MIANSRNLLGRAHRARRRFPADRKGGVATIFAITFPVIGFLSLVVVDYSRASTARQSLQETLDAAALIVARSSAITDEAVDTVGDKAFAAQLPANSGILGVSSDGTGRIANVIFTVDGNKIVGSAQGEITPLVANLFLNGNMQVGAQSEVVRTVNKLEIALVLDTTGSMDTNNRIGKLRTAANGFIDQMAIAAAKSTEVNPVKIAIVPFSTTVRVSEPIDVTSYGVSPNAVNSMAGLPAWLDGRSRAWNDSTISNYLTKVTFNTAIQDRFTFLKQMKQPWGGCVEARRAPYDIRDTPPSTASNPTLEETKTLFTPYFWPDDPDPQAKNKNGSFGTFKNNYLTDLVYSTTDWKVPQRNNTKYDIGSGSITSGTFSLGSGYGANLTYGPNAGCGMQSMKRLSTDFAALKTKVNALVASGETNIPLGLMWGWHALSPNAPFGDGVTYGTPKTQKIIILMTDGDNTMNVASNNNASHYHGYGYIWQDRLGTTSGDSGTRTDKLDERMVAPTSAPNREALCANIKAKGIKIYTVGVGVSSTSVTLLTNCATASDHYYNVDSQAGNLNAAFSAIAGRIENLRISH